MAKRRSFDWNAVNEKIKEMEKRPSFDEGEDQYYKPKTDEHGNSNVLIRFLPPHLDEEVPFVKIYSHGFKGVNGWFIENCPTTIGEKCPLCSYNSSQWDSDPDGVRSRKRKVNFHANILVVKDPLSPENDGKVFKFRYGIKLHQKLMEKISPESEIDEPVNIFDYDKGANFKLKIKMQQIKGFSKPVPNYDASSFAEPTPIALNGVELTDQEIDELDGKLFKLQPIIAKSEFASYKDLANKLFTKTGINVPLDPNQRPASKQSAPKVEEMREAPKSFDSFNDDEDDDKEESTSSNQFINDDDDNDDDFFAKLREQS